MASATAAPATSASASASAFVTAMDSHTPTQLGENSHSEYTWSHDLQEKIVQLSFQLVRTTRENAKQLADKFLQTTQTLRGKPRLEQYRLLDVMRRLVLQTRDIESKGEWCLGYNLIHSWYRVNPSEAFKMIYYLVHDVPGDKPHPYGSWKDIKALWRVFGGVNAPTDFTEFIVKLVNTQLRADIQSDKPSLCARHIPRQKAGKNDPMPYRPLYELLAEDYFKTYLDSARSEPSRVAARRKAWTHYRQQVLAPLNRLLETPQVKQCAGQYSEIDYAKHVTSVTLRKQTKAFQNLTKKNEQRSDDPDRVAAAANFEDFVSRAEKGEVKVKGKRVGTETMISDALNKQHGMTQTDKTVLNRQWENAGESIPALGEMIAMCDLSGSMSGDPMNAAIGLSLRVAEKSNMGRRVLTFSENCEWMNFDGMNDLTDMMSVMRENMVCGKWGMNTNFKKALTMILDICVKNQLPAEVVENMVLAIFSDMQIDHAGDTSDSMWNMIERDYAEAGRRAIGVPYKCPHILFWNLRSTSGFPTLSTQRNTTMFAGYSPALLDSFCENGMAAVKEFTPWNQLNTQLQNPRYDIMNFPTPY